MSKRRKGSATEELDAITRDLIARTEELLRKGTDR